MTRWSPFAERSLTLVAADFGDLDTALAAAAALQGEEVSVIAPGDPQALAARKLEPDQRGIWRTMLKSHLVLAAGGALLGVTVALALVAGWPAAASSPLYTLMAAAMLGAFAGMLLAGALTLRPDHAQVIRRVHAALQRGRWAVVVHPLDAGHARHAVQAMRAAGARPMRSF